MIVLFEGESDGTGETVLMECSVSERNRLAALKRYNILDTAPEAFFDRITRLAKTVLQTPIVLVSLIDSDRQWFKSKQGLEATETSRAISFCTHAIQHDVPLIVPNALEHPLFCNNPLVVGEPYIRFYIGVPLKMHDGHKIGTLCAIDQKPRELSTEQINALIDLARLIVDEIELRQIAMIDSLTGALTRRGFEIGISREVKRAKQYHHDLSLIAFDIDHFKMVNDCYGHAAGDIVLQTVVAHIKQELRSVDFVARLGGDEFVIALPETDFEKARELAERIRQKLANTVVQADSSTICVTGSFGISSHDGSDNAWTMMLERADAALYEAKNGGRNRSVCYENYSGIQLVA
jgi:diguanylate cyclase (GGDEF)-like protein